MIGTRRVLWSAMFILAAASLAARARAQERISYEASIPPRATNWSSTISLPKFDPSLGRLQRIDFTFVGQLTGSAQAENQSSSAAIVTLNFTCTMTLTRPDNSTIVVALPRQVFTDELSAYDGTLDFGGRSGVTHEHISVRHSVTVHSPPPVTDLALFTGLAGDVGQIHLPITAAGTSTHTGPGNLTVLFMQQASAAVTVCYTYAPTVQAYCFGDGSGGVDCPCGNSTPGNPAGCLNSTGLGGLLTSRGTPSVSNDTFHLMTTQLPPDVPGFFFQGTSVPVNHQGGFGIPFGGGFLCVGGTIVRMGKFENPPGGSAVLPFPGDPPLSVQFNLHPGDERLYQVWYRDGHGPCGLQFNTTNALRMHWLP
jgi:hypothetical protein